MSRYCLRDALRQTNGTQLLRAAATGRFVGVARAAGVLRGYVVAQLDVFRDKRGKFGRQSLERIVQLGNAATRGVRAHSTHGGICDGQLGNFFGRSRKYRLDTTTNAVGERVDAVRGDLVFDAAALRPPPKGGRPPGP